MDAICEASEAFSSSIPVSGGCVRPGLILCFVVFFSSGGIEIRLVGGPIKVGTGWGLKRFCGGFVPGTCFRLRPLTWNFRDLNFYTSLWRIISRFSNFSLGSIFVFSLSWQLHHGFCVFPSLCVYDNPLCCHLQVFFRSGLRDHLLLVTWFSRVFSFVVITHVITPNVRVFTKFALTGFVNTFSRKGLLLDSFGSPIVVARVAQLFFSCCWSHTSFGLIHTNRSNVGHLLWFHLCAHVSAQCARLHVTVYVSDELFCRCIHPYTLVNLRFNHECLFSVSL